MDRVVAVNDLSQPFILSVGQQLEIPVTTIYAVEAGNTLFGIAQDHGVKVAALAALNDIGPPYTIAVGQELAIPPEGAATPKRAAISGEQTPSAPAGQRQIVRELPATPARDGDGFAWPVDGRVIAGFGRTGDQPNQ